MAKGNIKLVEMHLDEQALAVVKEYAKAQAKVDALIAVKADAGFNKEFFEEALNDEEIKKTYNRNYNLLYNALTKGNMPKEAKPKPSIFKKLKK